MAAGRVLSTPEAQASIQQIESILNENFLNSIQQLNTQGSQLSEPSIWDGSLAAQFRSDTWPQCSTALQNAYNQLTNLSQQLKLIQSNIQQAGGNV